MPALVRLYIRNVALGLLLSVIFVAALLWLNIGNLWHLVTATREGPVAVAMLVIFNAIVFSGVQFGIAVMRMAEPEDRGPGGGKARRPAPSMTDRPLPAILTAQACARPSRRVPG